MSSITLLDQAFLNGTAAEPSLLENSERQNKTRTKKDCAAKAQSFFDFSGTPGPIRRATASTC